MRLFITSNFTKLEQKSLFNGFLILNLTTAFLFPFCLRADASGFPKMVNLFDRDASQKKMIKNINCQNFNPLIYNESLLDINKKEPLGMRAQNISFLQVPGISSEEQSSTYSNLKKMVADIKKGPGFPLEEIVLAPASQLTLIKITGVVTGCLGTPFGRCNCTGKRHSNTHRYRFEW